MYRIACLLLCALSLPSHALTKVDVFKTEVVLTEQEKAESLAQAQGLEQVLVMASGQKSLQSNEVVRKALRSSGQYLSQISSGNIGGKPSLAMTFNPKQIQSLLTQAALPYWSPTRSNVLVWLVEEDRYQRQIAWEQSGSDAIAQLEQFAQLRGLPITVPVGDFDDVTGISAPDLWGGFVAPISQASVRYPADAVLVLRVQHLSNRTTVRWTLFDQKPESMISEQTSPLSGQESGAIAPVLEQVIDQVSDYFAGKSAVQVANSSTQSVMTEFVDVDNATDFFHLEALLKGLNSVASVDVMKIQSSGITFRVHLLASQSDFERELSNFKQVQKFELSPDVLPLPRLPSQDAPVDQQTLQPIENVNPTETVITDSDSEPMATIEPVHVSQEAREVEENRLVYEWLG